LKDGRFSYPENRPLPLFNSTVLEDDAAHSLHKISFQSHGALVYGLLRIPKNAASPAVVIILPGATVPKEARQPLAKTLAENGFASLSLDLRGNGETMLDETSRQKELDLFEKGGEILDARMTLDVLKAFDVLKKFPVNHGKVFLLGESMGGRFAVMAAAVEPKIAGVIVVASAGYGLPSGNTLKETSFLRAVDPDYYIPLVKKPMLFFHSKSDAVIPFSSAEKTFSLANRPKEFFTVDCSHGYCLQMAGKVLEWLKRNV
jgi:fermentation-respiration switch protein FrsA (DUF1100 family)